jgi:hypothetical protein
MEEIVAMGRAQLGRWVVAAYVVVSAPVFVLTILGWMNVGGLGVWPTVSARAAQFLAQHKWEFYYALLALGAALTFLDWPSRGGAGLGQRWANRISNVTFTLWLLPVVSDGLSRDSLTAVISFALAFSWAVEGRFLRIGYCGGRILTKETPCREVCFYSDS